MCHLLSSPHHVPTDQETGEVKEGLVDLVCEAIANPDPVEPNTLEEMEEWGTADPVPYLYGYDAPGKGEGVCIIGPKGDARPFFNLVSQLDIAEDVVEKWFGMSRNQIRDRAIMLVENGHINPRTLRIYKVKKKISKTESDEYVYLLEAKVVASQKTQWYWTRVAISSDWKQLLSRPYSSCECVVRRGPACSHQLAVVLFFMTVKIVMGRVESKLWLDVKKHLPDHIILLQKVPMTVNYAYGPGSMSRLGGMFILSMYMFILYIINIHTHVTQTHVQV